MSRRITQREQPEHSCRLQLLEWPETAEPCRAKEHPLHPRRSYFAPIKSRLMRCRHERRRLMVEAPGTAPGSDRLITISIYRHSWRTSPRNIDRSAPVGKTNAHEMAKRSNRATPRREFMLSLPNFEGEAVRGDGAKYPPGVGIANVAAPLIVIRPAQERACIFAHRTKRLPMACSEFTHVTASKLAPPPKTRRRCRF